MYRYVVPVDDKPHTIELAPARAADFGPLHLAATLHQVEFWAVHSDEYADRPIPFTFQVFGTGHDVPPGADVEPGVAVVHDHRYPLPEGNTCV